MKKYTAFALTAAVVMGLTAIPAAADEGAHIYVLTAPESHSWNGSVAAFAKKKIKEVNKEGTYTAELITSTGSEEQIAIIEDIISDGEDDVAVVIQPLDGTVESAISELVDAGIPYVAFDRIINGVADEAVSNVKGDNEGVGAACAAYFVSLGMQPGDGVYVYETDSSLLTTMRDDGFIRYLTGELEYEGKTIPEDAKWSIDDLGSITFSGAMNWSRSETKDSFERLMSDASNADIKWIYTEDDELAMGILEALDGDGIEDETKEAFLGNAPAISGCGGLDEFYAVLRGETFDDIASRLGGLVSVTYSPAMIRTAIQDMVDYLDGEEVVQDHVIACENVTSENVSDYPSF